MDYDLIIEAQERKIATLGQQASAAPKTADDAECAERQGYEKKNRFPGMSRSQQ